MPEQLASYLAIRIEQIGLIFPVGIWMENTYSLDLHAYNYIYKRIQCQDACLI